MSKAVCETQEVVIEESYKIIRQSIISGQTKMIKQVNQTLISGYHKVGKEINEIIGDNKRSKYKDEVISIMSVRLVKEFGKGFTKTNLYYMRNFYLMFQIFHTVCGNLSWSHYRLLMKK